MPYFLESRIPFQSKFFTRTGLVLFGVKFSISKWQIFWILALIISFSTHIRADAGSFRYGVYNNFPKIYMDDNGQPGGIFPDLVNEIAVQSGWSFHPVSCEWSKCLQMLEAGEIDFLPDVAESLERRSKYDFHEEPMLNSWSQIYARDEITIDSLLDLNGKRLVALRGSVQLEYLSKLKTGLGITFELVQVSTFEDGFRSVADGKGDAVISNHNFGDVKAPEYHLTKTPIILFPSALYLAASKRKNLNAELGLIDQQLVRWKADPSSFYYRTLEKWSGGGGLEYRLSRVVVWIIIGSLSAFLITLIVGFLLKRQVKRVTNDLQSTQAGFNVLLDASGAHWYRADLKAGLIQVNEGWRRFYNLPKLEYPEISIEQLKGLMPVKNNDAMMQVIEGAKSEPDGYSSVFEMLDGQGKLRTLRNFTTPSFDESGNLIGVEGYSFDITDVVMLRHQLQEALEKGKTGFFGHDLRTGRVELSPSARTLLDLPETQYPDPVMIKAVLDKVDPVYLPTAIEEMQVNAVTEDGYMDIWPLLSDTGEKRYILIQGKPEFDSGVPVKSAGTITDVTELKRAEDAANDATEALKEEARKRNHLFGMVAHELRTPVAAISMMTEEKDPAEWQKDQAYIQRIVQDLLHTIDDMRLLINPELARPIRHEDFTVGELNASIDSSVASIVSATGIHYQGYNEIPEPFIEERYTSDIYRLRVAITNVVKNACLHSNGTEVSLVSRLGTDHSGEAFLEWLIADNGDGIPEDLVEHLFESGERGDSSVDGSGLGLFITRSWIEEIGGTVSYQPRITGGSEFLIRVPLVRTRDAPQVEIAEDTVDQDQLDDVLSQLNVLMVEDEAVLRMLGEKLLSTFVGSIQVAKNGVDALQLFNPAEHNLILTDYFMPEMSGVELTRKLRGQGYEGLIIGITAATIGEQEKEMLKAGVDRVLPKPLNAEIFKRTVLQLIDEGRFSEISNGEE